MPEPDLAEQTQEKTGRTSVFFDVAHGRSAWGPCVLASPAALAAESNSERSPSRRPLTPTWRVLRRGRESAAHCHGALR